MLYLLQKLIKQKNSVNTLTKIRVISLEYKTCYYIRENPTIFSKIVYFDKFLSDFDFKSFELPNTFKMINHAIVYPYSFKF